MDFAIASVYLYMLRTRQKSNRTCNTPNKNLHLILLRHELYNCTTFENFCLGCYTICLVLLSCELCDRTQFESYRIRKSDSHYFSHSTSCNNMAARCFTLFWLLLQLRTCICVCRKPRQNQEGFVTPQTKIFICVHLVSTKCDSYHFLHSTIFCDVTATFFTRLWRVSQLWTCIYMCCNQAKIK